MSVHAQEVYQELKETVRADVLEILHEETREIEGTGTGRLVQEVRIQIKEGAKTGEVVSFDNDIIALHAGDSIYVNRLETIDGVEYYMLKDADRTFALTSIGVVFVCILLLFSGLHGIRALLSLLLSVVILLLLLVPLILKGYPPVLMSIVVAGPILAGALFITHGVHPRSIIAFFGTFGAVLITGFVATFWVGMAHLTGLSADEAIYLNFSTHGTLDFGGILLGSIIIGILGILDDVSITQASVVAELRSANKTLSFIELYRRALRVGRDHIGSLVNTLSLAYVGASLPLILLLVQAKSNIVLALNQEIVAVELIRIFIGSIGLILAVPLTTLIAAWWYGTHTDAEIRHEAHGHSHVH